MTETHDQAVWDAAPQEVQDALMNARVFYHHKESAEARVKAALFAAHTLGTSLEVVRNKYADAFDSVLEKAQVSKPLADRLLRFSKETTLDDIKLGRIRQGMLELQFVPPAQKQHPIEDRRMDALPHISGMVLHWRRVSRLMDLGQLRVDREQVKTKTKELFKWLSEIHGEQE
jgi:hypothetical protein